MKSKEEYYNILEHIDKIKKPTQKSIEKAKQYINVYKALVDELTDLFVKTRKSVIDSLKEESRSDKIIYDNSFRKFSPSYIELLKRNNIRLSEVYLLKNLYEV